MEQSLVSLCAANVTFVGMHFAMSHPLRGPMVGALGERGFQLFYTLVSLAAFGWIVMAFKASPSGDLPGSGEVGWVVATLLTIPAMVLLAGSLVGNPALPTPLASKQAREDARGVFRVTRHPMMWGIALWALSHFILASSWRTTITASAMGILALVGAALQDRKKEALMGPAWQEWERKTNFWPRWEALARAGHFPWAAGIALFLLLTWLHYPLGGIPAGPWAYLLP